MSYRRPLIGLSIFLAAALIGISMVVTTLRREVAGPTNTYSALFTDVSGLHPGDDVRVAGVRVGRVERIDLVGRHANVTFLVQRDQTLYTDTVASVTYQNIIGQRYLGLSPGNSDDRLPLENLAQIPLERTRPSFDISHLLNGFEPLLALLDPQQVDNLTNGIIQALQGDSSSVLTLITETSALAESLAGPDQVLGDVITGLNDVMTNLANQNSDLQAVIGQSSDIMATFGDRRDQLVASAGSINRAVARLAEITDSVYPDLQELIDREPGIFGYLSGAGRDRFSYFGANLVLALKGLGRATQEGTYVSAYICDVNSTMFAFLGRLIPAVVRLASPGNTVQHSPICR